MIIIMSSVMILMTMIIISSIMRMIKTWQLEVISDRRTVPSHITIRQWLLYLLRIIIIIMIIMIMFITISINISIIIIIIIMIMIKRG